MRELAELEACMDSIAVRLSAADAAGDQAAYSVAIEEMGAAFEAMDVFMGMAPTDYVRHAADWKAYEDGLAHMVSRATVSANAALGLSQAA